MPRPSITSTPEQLLGRKDSKNPSTTCKGITSTGRPCRRALAVSKLAAGTLGQDEDGVAVLVHENDLLTGAQYYCWQHKDQVSTVPTSLTTATRQRRDVLELKNRSSISSLMQNLNIEVDDKRSRATRLQTVPEQTTRLPKRSHRAPSKQPNIWRSMCCMLAAEDDDTIEVIRHKQRVRQGRTQHCNTASVPIKQIRPAKDVQPLRNRQADPQQPLSYIRAATEPQIAAALLTELSKPISPHDEQGYIYMFWLTPSSRGMPQEGTARGLLSPRNRQDRRLSDVMSDFSVPEEDMHGRNQQDRQIMLKIGRANNVTRRMNEWQRQCGYELSLIRWYPYVSQSSSRSPRRPSEQTSSGQPLYPDLTHHLKPTNTRQGSDNVRKVPCVKRVERLIHLELSARQAKRQCSSCGREHREWFTIDANEQGVRQVDEIIRRWIQWSEGQHVG